MSYNSQLTFYKNSNFVNNSGTLGGGMALYDSSHLILKKQTNTSFVNNYVSDLGRGIFVSEPFIACDFSTYCFLYLNMIQALMQHYNKTKILFDVLYGGIVDYCLNTHEFHELF